ncbi:hypothetical protein GCM10011391_14560 [Pullulanibacillus camelliae]|uniref:Uncharacterized protein n=1 Tax=Pullulanibacillus camelliae TaxID=1707096 RepID=A0A8J2VPF0_9BACL|nr:hypothetical protein GCM10011391_14560 [Pullulanibacillus camelliae]
MVQAKFSNSKLAKKCANLYNKVKAHRVKDDRYERSAIKRALGINR